MPTESVPESRGCCLVWVLLAGCCLCCGFGLVFDGEFRSWRQQGRLGPAIEAQAQAAEHAARGEWKAAVASYSVAIDFREKLEKSTPRELIDLAYLYEQRAAVYGKLGLTAESKSDLERVKQVHAQRLAQQWGSR